MQISWSIFTIQYMCVECWNCLSTASIVQMSVYLSSCPSVCPTSPCLSSTYSFCVFFACLLLFCLILVRQYKSSIRLPSIQYIWLTAIYSMSSIFTQCTYTLYPAVHRRRMERETKAKVVASVWADFVQFLATLAVLPRSIWKNRMNSIFSFKYTKTKQLAWQGI